MQLFIQTGPKAGEQYDLGGKPLILGTGSENEIAVPDTTMAERHARFENIGGAIFVADLESANGTYLNGQRMSPGARYPLRPDDTLQIGSTVFKVQEPAPVAAPTTAPAASADANQALQPYQYQLSTTYSAPKPAAPVAAAPQVQKTKRKIHWPSVISAVIVVIALNAAVIYFITSNTSNTLEINNSGQATRVQGRLTARPTNTPDQSGALFKGPTPGIGANITSATPIQLDSNDLPVYPGARRIDTPNSAVFFTQYITSDSFDKLSDWARTAFSDKGWTNIEMKSLPGKDGAVVTGVKGKMSLVTYLLGPGQKDTAPYDNFFKNANVDPNGAVVVINVTVS